MLGGVGLVGAILTGNFWLSLAFLTLSLAGINAARGIFFTIPMRFLSGMALAGGLAFINSIGTAGGFVGPIIMGTVRRPDRLVHGRAGRAGGVSVRRRGARPGRCKFSSSATRKFRYHLRRQWLKSISAIWN